MRKYGTMRSPHAAPAFGLTSNKQTPIIKPKADGHTGLSKLSANPPKNASHRSATSPGFANRASNSPKPRGAAKATMGRGADTTAGTDLGPSRTNKGRQRL